MFSFPWYMNIDSNQFINIEVIYDNLGCETSDVTHELHAVTVCDTRHSNLMLKRSTFVKTFVKIPSVSL